MDDLISRQAAIDTEGLNEEIRCEMCRNPIHTNRGCDGNCRYDEKLYKKIIQILDKRIKPLPPAQPYTEADIQKMQDLEQAEIQKAYELGREEGQKEAQPEHRWIPCKTALPEKGQYVLCQCRVGIMDVLHLTDDNGWYKDSTHIYMHGFVLAWMPLPEPYREEGEE